MSELEDKLTADKENLEVAKDKLKAANDKLKEADMALAVENAMKQAGADRAAAEAAKAEKSNAGNPMLTTASKSTLAAVEKKALPQTGNTSAVAGAAVGILGSLALALGISSRKRKQN